ncbi:MAG: LLM class flavin-dependent oxidoreductase [Chloroflexi bacterium]|nr:MAG: LLM class flavin-dependent oxidoreductase [Chloroflexota bacterium]
MTEPFLGLHVPSFTYPGAEGAGLFPRLAEISATAERSGFTALSVMDHFHQIAPAGRTDEPMLEAYTTLGALAARTERIQLYTLVTARRHLGWARDARHRRRVERGGESRLRVRVPSDR